MPKKPSSSQNLYPNLVSGSSLLSQPYKRRPIHEESQHSNESGEKYERKGVSLKFSKLYPELPDEDEPGEDEPDEDESHKDESREDESDVGNTSKESWKLNLQIIPSWFYYILGLVLISFIGYVLCFYNDTKDPKQEGIKNVVEIIKDMQNHFQYQPSLTYRFLKSELKKVVNVRDEPSAPAIITFIVNERDQNTASEFSLYLAKALASEEYVSINGSAYSYENPDEIKLKIDEEIKHRVQKDKLNVIIIDKLQNIPFEAAMIFHGYCDHQLAPYKRAVFLFIVSVNEIIPETANSKHLDSVATKHLRSTWKDETFDKLEPLITRLTVAVISIR